MKHAAIAFSNEHPGEGDWKEWPALKADHPERGGLPWFTDANGKVFNQSDAILRALAQQAGYTSADPWVQYECEWVFETMADFSKVEGGLTPFFRPAFGGPVGTEEECNKS